MCLKQGEDLGLGYFETECFHGDFEFMIVDLLVFVQVEELELESQLQLSHSNRTVRPLLAARNPPPL